MGKRPETPRSGRRLAALEPSASLPAGLAHSARPTHSLTPYTAESEGEGGAHTHTIDLCTHTHTHTRSLTHVLTAGEDKSDSISSEDEIAFSSDEEDGLTTTAVDHYESLVSLSLCVYCVCVINSHT